MPQRMLITTEPTIDDLVALLAETRGTRDRARTTWRAAQAKCLHLQHQLRLARERERERTGRKAAGEA